MERLYIQERFHGTSVHPRGVPWNVCTSKRGSMERLNLRILFLGSFNSRRPKKSRGEQNVPVL